MSEPTARRRTDLALAVVVAFAITGPLLLGRGFWLAGDMVFVPRQPWKPAWLGLDGALPRAVPMDALVSIATQVVPGDLLQKVLLAGGLVLGGHGAARLAVHVLAPRCVAPWYARAAAVTALCWNPWVHERLLIGQWAILLGYLLLPWVALAALRWREDGGAWAPLALALVASAVASPSSGVMAVAVAAVLAVGRRLPLAGMALAANIVWVLPALMATAAGTTVSTRVAFEGFAARAESPLGLPASLLSMGGIWKESIVPPERQLVLGVAFASLLSLACLVALHRAPDRARWWGIGLGALGVALLPALPGGAEALGWLGDRLPGTALLRDSHRFLAPLGLVLALGAAELVVRLRGAVRAGTGALWSAIGLVVIAPVLLLPNLAWGAGGDLSRATYPAGWARAASLIGDDDVTVVLPWAGSYRGFAWNGRRAMLDPAPRFLPGTVLVDDTVVLDDVSIPAEDPRVRLVDAALARGAEASPSALRALGVRWVLVEDGVGGPPAPEGPVRLAADGLRLIDLAEQGPVAATETLRHAGAVRKEEEMWPIGPIPPILLISAGGMWILRRGSNARHTS